MVTVILDSVRDALTFWHFVRFILVFSEIFFSFLPSLHGSFIHLDERYRKSKKRWTNIDKNFGKDRKKVGNFGLFLSKLKTKLSRKKAERLRDAFKAFPIILYASANSLYYL